MITEKADCQRNIELIWTVASPSMKDWVIELIMKLCMCLGFRKKDCGSQKKLHPVLVTNNVVFPFS